MEEPQAGHRRFDHANAHRDGEQPEDKEGETEPAGHPRRRGHHVQQQGVEDEQLDGGAVLHQPEKRAAVVQDHHLVNHRQLEVGGRIVHRHAAALGEQDDEDPGRRQDEGGRPLEPGPLGRPQHAGEAEGAGEPGEGEEGEEERGLGQPGEAHLARRPHTFERRAGVESGGRGEEAAEREEIGEEDEVAGEGDRRRERAERHQQPGHHRRHHGEDGGEHEHPGRRGAQRHTLAQELHEVEVGLPDAGSPAPGEERLGPGDDPPEQRRQQRQHGGVRDHGPHSVLTTQSRRRLNSSRSAISRERAKLGALIGRRYPRPSPR